MNNNNRNFSITKSSSINSLNQQTIFETSILTSTKNPELIIPTYAKTDRRQSIIPTLYRSKGIKEPGKIVNSQTETSTLLINEQLNAVDIIKDGRNNSRFDLYKMVDKIDHNKRSLTNNREIIDKTHGESFDIVHNTAHRV
ncbi:unnamed protein product [Rotaria sp. Silwood2]|nr:unnamed protein product [Rotaria sp. Silwood2]